MSIDWPTPTTGVVMQKRVIEGQMVKAGEELYRLADLTNIWVIADVAEQDWVWCRIGAPAKVTFRAFPGSTFEGRVTFVLHELDMSTRTAKVRIEVSNPDHLIKHEMYADVEIGAGAGDAARLVVPGIGGDRQRHAPGGDRRQGRGAVSAAAREARHARRRHGRNPATA